MSEFFVYYTESNAVCFIVFAIFLIHDLSRNDRQEKQIKFDKALVAFMLYFASDCLWAAVDSAVIPKNQVTVVLTDFLNYNMMIGITIAWLRYVMAVEKVPKREDRISKFAVSFPFLVSTIIMVTMYIIDPGLLINEKLEILPAFFVFFLIVPYIYIAAVLIYTLKKAKSETNPVAKRAHLFVGFFPLIVVAGGMVEILLLPTTPVFCFSCTFLMLVFYIKSMDTQISTDALTQLNNRGQLINYVSQKTNLYKEDRMTFVFMIDINKFKSINDIYGHAEGDRALVLVADALRRTVSAFNMPLFLGRYGGDEFIIIIHPTSEDAAKEMESEIRRQIRIGCEADDRPYVIGVGIGYDELCPGDTFEACQERADGIMYENKKSAEDQ